MLAVIFAVRVSTRLGPRRHDRDASDGRDAIRASEMILMNTNTRYRA